MVIFHSCVKLPEGRFWGHDLVQSPVNHGIGDHWCMVQRWREFLLENFLILRWWMMDDEWSWMPGNAKQHGKRTISKLCQFKPPCKTKFGKHIQYYILYICIIYIYILYYMVCQTYIYNHQMLGPNHPICSPRVIIKVEGCNEVRLIFEVGIPGSGCHIVCFHSRQWHGFSLSGRGAATIFDVDYIPLHSQGVGCRNEQHVINVRRTCALRLNPW